MDSSVLATETEKELSAAQRYEAGVATFSRLFTRWMDQNAWSHPVMTSLAKACTGGTSWLHSSQITGLRHGRMRSPGPRTFIAIQRLNEALYLYREERRLIPGTTSSNNYANPYVITEGGRPPSVGWFVDVFCGDRIPEDESLLQPVLFTEASADKASQEYGRYLRYLFALKRVDLITELDSVLQEHYPITDPHRRDKLRDVLLGRSAWSADELNAEMPFLAQLTSAFGGASSEQDLLDELR